MSEIKPMSEIEPWKDASTLEYLYWERKMTTQEIGNRFGVSPTSVLRKMHYLGVETRSSHHERVTNEDLLDWIDAFVEYFGVVPTDDDLRGWPGPSRITYQKRFGSVAQAVEEAGYERRGK